MMEKFKQQYIEKCIHGKGFDDELNQLFEQILSEEFEDNHDKMDDLIHSIIEENTPRTPTEIELLKQENEQLTRQVNILWQNAGEIASSLIKEVSE